jgi:hypothetical protein
VARRRRTLKGFLIPTLPEQLKGRDIMHALHFLVVPASSAEEAASIAESDAMASAREDNWFFLGGIASEDGTDDRELYQTQSRFPLSYLDAVQEAPKQGTPFARAVGWVRQHLSRDVQRDLERLGNELLRLSRLPEDQPNLWSVSEELSELHAVVYARQVWPEEEIPEYRGGEYTHFGLTHLRPNPDEEDDTKRRYVVFLDMHC